MLAFIFGMLGYTLLMLWKDVALYRNKFRQALRMGIMLAFHSGKRNTIFVLIFTIWCSLLWLFVPMQKSMLIPLVVLVGSVSRLSAIIRPPGIMLLASSKSWNFKLIASSIRPRTPYQIIYLLRSIPVNTPDNFFDSIAAHEVDSMSNRYMISDETWKSTVFPLMDIVPVILIDATYLNESVAHELNRILEKPDLLGKSLVIIPEGPFYMQNLQYQIDINRFVKCENIDEIIKRAAKQIVIAKKRAWDEARSPV